jgi:hypothetical protein
MILPWRLCALVAMVKDGQAVLVPEPRLGGSN